MTIEPRGSQDYERRSVWLALAVGLAVILRYPGIFGYGGEHHKFQVWAYVASLIAFGLSLVLCFLLLLPELRTRLGRRLRQDRTAFVWALGLFVLGIVITIVTFAELAIDSLDEESQLGDISRD